MVLARKTPKCRNRAPSRNLHPREAAEQILRFYVQLKRCLTIAKRNVLLFKPVHLQDVFATCAFEILQKIFRSSQVTEHQLIEVFFSFPSGRSGLRCFISLLCIMSIRLFFKEWTPR